MRHNFKDQVKLNDNNEDKELEISEKMVEKKKDEEEEVKKQEKQDK